MRIGVDARPLREKQTSGIPRYARSLLSALGRIDKKNEYILYAHKDFHFENGGNFFKRSGALTRYGSVWMQAELPLWLSRDKIDLFWGTQHILPLAMSNKIKSVVTVHDLVHYVFPETMKTLNLIINKLIIPPSIRRTDAVVAISNWTLSDVRKYLNPQAKIMEVAHLGVGENFYPRKSSEVLGKLTKKYNLPFPFLLTVGTFEPRKNIVGIFKAFSRISHQIPHHLVVVGQRGWKNKSTVDEIMKSRLSERVHFLGYLQDDEIPEIYSSAEMFIFPSLYEGFGLPPLEAMACAVPVLTSNVSSLPEVVGEAAHLVNPQSLDEISNGILKIISNAGYRQSLIQKGLEQAKMFTWEKTAQKMLSVFEMLS